MFFLWYILRLTQHSLLSKKRDGTGKHGDEIKIHWIKQKIETNRTQRYGSAEDSTMIVFPSSQVRNWLDLAMNKQHFHHIISFTILGMLLFIVAGCMESRVNSTEDLPGSQFRGSVRLQAEDNSFEINKNLVLVRLEGTGFETLTDTAGKWTLNLVPQGTYTISYSKPGYSTAKRFSVRCDGKFPVIVKPMTLAQLPSYSVDVIETTVLNDSLIITCKTATLAMQDRRVIVYVDTVMIDSNKLNTYLFTNLDMVIKAGTNAAQLRIPLSDLAAKGIQSGSTVFVSGFGIVRFEATADESFLAIDPITKKTIFWNIRFPGATSEFTVP